MIPFLKLHGTGNDFVVISRAHLPPKGLSSEQIRWLTHRRFGVGADGVIVLHHHPAADFEMLYYNADGNIGSLCGNGSRCAVLAAQELNIIPKNKHTVQFLAFDGIHQAYIHENKDVTIELNSPKYFVRLNETDFETDTGSPHFVRFIQGEFSEEQAFQIGRKIRYSEPYKKQGINVNFVQIITESQLFVWTYERGVEAVTFSCGTGVTAAAIAYRTIIPATLTEIQTMGGKLSAKTDFINQKFSLHGKVTFVFKGEISSLSTI